MVRCRLASVDGTEGITPRGGGWTLAPAGGGKKSSAIRSCPVSRLWTSSRARLGNSNLEYLCIDACNSVELTRDPVATWHGAFQGLRMVFGFTDTVSDSWWTGGRGNDFGRRAGNGDRLTDAWLDAGYSFWLDDNPVAMAAGRNQADAENRLANERLGGGFGDIPNNQIGWYAWRWRS